MRSTSEKIVVVMQRVQAEGPLNAMCVGKNTGLVFATCEGKNLNLWSGDHAQPTVVFGPMGSLLTACEFAFDESKIACGSQSGTVRFFDIDRRKSVSTFTAHRCEVTAIAFNPVDSKMMYSVACDGMLQVMCILERTPTATFSVHNGPARCLAVSPDGRYVATGGDDKMVAIVDLTAGAIIGKYEAHQGAVTSLEFSADGNILVSGGADRQTKFYDMTTMSIMEVNFPRHSTPISQILFNAKHNVAIPISNDCLHVLGGDPPTDYTRVKLDLKKVHHACMVMNNIIIASSDQSKAIITRVKAGKIEPFCGISKPVTAKRPIGAQPKKPFENTASLYTSFINERDSFMAEMTERYRQIQEIDALIKERNFTGALEVGVAKPEIGKQLLVLLAKKPQPNLKLDNAIVIMEIARQIIKTDPEISVTTVDNQLKSFGRIVKEARRNGATGIDIALEERKQKGEMFVDVFKKIAKSLEQISRAGRTQTAVKAGAILTEWKILLK